MVTSGHAGFTGTWTWWLTGFLVPGPWRRHEGADPEGLGALSLGDVVLLTAPRGLRRSPRAATAGLAPSRVARYQRTIPSSLGAPDTALGVHAAAFARAEPLTITEVLQPTLRRHATPLTR
ncbi:MAG TPA: hypothetical protein VFZ21_06810 [Gemmatimonadaceae bacterium]|nr:hypothetical protein [Gemmatimonadaceae bacterium]